MEFWYDFSDTSTFTTSGSYPNQTITSDITDKSPTGRNLTNTLRAGAVFNYDAVNKGFYTNRAGLNFTIAYSASLASETVFFVLTINEVSASTNSVLGSTAIGGRGYRIGGSKMQCAKDGSGVNVQSATVIPATCTGVFTWLKNNNFIYMYFNGALIASGAVSTLTAGLTSGFGATTSQSSDFFGTVHESIAYSSPLSDSDRSAIEYYLMNKWRVPTSSSSLIPTSIGGSSCVLWLDSSDASSITYDGGNLVSQWSDKSGSNNHATQSTASAKPTYTTTGIKFGGTGGLTTAKLVSPYSLTNQTETSFFVVETDPTTLATGWIMGSSDTSTGRFYRNSTVSTTMQIYTGGTFIYSTLGEINELGKRYIIHGYIGGGLSTLTINNSYESIQTVAYGTGTTSTVIGSRLITAADTSAFAGKLCEVIVYNTALSSSNRKSVLNYLASKWNITAGNTSIPATHPYYYGSPYTRSFYPIDIQNCTLWLDAADSTTLPAGSSVTQWTDKSPNNYNATTFNSAPTYSNNAVNFSGTQGLTTSLSASSNTETGFFVFGSTDVVSSVNTLVGGASSTGGRQFVVYASDLQTLKQDSSTVLSAGSPALTNNIKYLAEYVNDGTTLTHYLNGTVHKSGTAVAYTAGILTTIGLRFGNTQGLKGYINEMVIYNRALSSNERQQIESYLAQKWGLTSYLPANHVGTLYKSLTVSFDPKVINGCKLWIDAYDSTTVQLTGSGGTVGTVLDKSGNANNLTSGTGFSYNQVKFNGSYPSFYNATSATTSLVGKNTSFTLSQPATFFVVGQSTSIAGDFPYLADSTVSSPRIALYYWNNAGSLRVRLFAGAEIEYAGASSIFINSYYANTTSSQIFVNGTSVVSGGISTGSFSGLTIGSYYGATTAAWAGHICEFIIFNSVLSQGQRQQVEGYLAHKWGLTSNLPSTHPYKKIKP